MVAFVVLCDLTPASLCSLISVHSVPDLLCCNYSGLERPLKKSLENIKLIALSEPLPCILLQMFFFFSFTIQISGQVPRDFPCFSSEGICPSPLYLQSLCMSLLSPILSSLIACVSFEIICSLFIFFNILCNGNCVRDCYDCLRH